MARPNKFNDPFKNLEKSRKAKKRVLERAEEKRVAPDRPGEVIEGLEGLPTSRYDWSKYLSQPMTSTTTVTGTYHGIYDTIMMQAQSATSIPAQFIVDYKYVKGKQNNYAKDLQETSEQSLKRGKLRILQEKRAAWYKRNKMARHDQLNTNKQSMLKATRHGMIKSIEFDMLKAIANGEPFKTTTTEYDPETRHLKVWGNVLAELSQDILAVRKIHFHDYDNDKRSNIQRLRLRQLGLKVLKIKGHTRLYLPDDTYVFFDEGMSYEIPPQHRRRCLPAYYERLMDSPHVFPPDMPFSQPRFKFVYDDFVYKKSAYRFDQSYVLDLHRCVEASCEIVMKVTRIVRNQVVTVAVVEVSCIPTNADPYLEFMFNREVSCADAYIDSAITTLVSKVTTEFDKRIHGIINNAAFGNDILPLNVLAERVAGEITRAEDDRFAQAVENLIRNQNTLIGDAIRTARIG
jgi:hypothetical protein